MKGISSNAFIALQEVSSKLEEIRHGLDDEAWDELSTNLQIAESEVDEAITKVFKTQKL